jgi:hypothetical protein
LNFKIYISVASSGQIELDVNTGADALETKLDSLLKKISKPQSTWQNKDGNYTARFQECHKKLQYSQLRRLKSSIWVALLLRNMEFQRIYHGSLFGITPVLLY